MIQALCSIPGRRFSRRKTVGMGDRDAHHDPSPLPSNLSSPSITPWVPNDFSIAVAINKDRPAMSVVGMYMNAIYTMYDLCNMDENANIPRRLWSLSDYGVTVEIGAPETRFAISGLQRTADFDASDAGLRPLISQLLLGGRDKGGVIIRPISVSLRNILPNSEGDNASAIPVQFVNHIFPGPVR